MTEELLQSQRERARLTEEKEEEVDPDQTVHCPVKD
jgi:hypothetical protein